MTFWQRLRNLWYLSGIEVHKEAGIPQALYDWNSVENNKGYIVGLSEEEQAFKDSLNYDNKDTLIL